VKSHKQGCIHFIFNNQNLNFMKQHGCKFIYALILTFSFNLLQASTLHVAKTGNDAGTAAAPFLTISKAATVAVAGDIILIHEGTYREYVNPSVGGTSNTSRITYKAAPNEKVFVKGSEVINNWVFSDSTWKVTLPNTYFKGYNPYTLFVNGDFQNYGKWHHRGDVYINNAVLSELQTLAQTKIEKYTWFTTATATETTIYANFGTENPNTQLTEINARELIFFSTNNSVDYITVDSLRFLHAAPNWQAPNEGPADPARLDQIGAVGSLMGKGWIIENCEIMYSKTAGIMFGESAGAQNTFEDVEAFGDHIIRNNVIHRCGEYGIAGQKGLSRCTISGNRVEDINYRNEFGGYEPAGIKVWNSVDVLIENNFVRNCIANQSDVSQAYCIWIDYGNQGTRITRNVLIGNPMTTTTLFLEANFGPTLVDNNIFVESAGKSIFVASQGSIFAHNLFLNHGFYYHLQNFDGSGARSAYSLMKHSLVLTNINKKVLIKHNKMYNNIFAGGGGPNNFSVNSGEGNVVDNNLYMNGTTPNAAHTNAKTSAFTLNYTISNTITGINFSFVMDSSFANINTPYVRPALINVIPDCDQTIEDRFGNGITVNKDFNLLARTGTYPKVGPLENLVSGANSVNVGTNLTLTAGTKHPIPVSIPPGAVIVPQAPYLGTPMAIPGTIEAENYDFGGQGVSFNDNNTKDGTLSLRPNDNVDLGGGPNGATVVGWFEAGEWMEYTVNVQSGNYTINLIAASGIAAPGELRLTINDTAIATIKVNSTNDWNNYTTFSVNNINIKSGTNAVLRLTSTGGFNVDKVVFTRDGVNGIIEENSLAKIYPNPVQNVLNIELKSGIVPLLKVYSVDNKLLMTVKTNQLDVSKLTAGTYYLVVEDKQTTKFIKH
jgi:Right handed beta helix region/Carbohydrate binding module (family 6)/Secretion system C-terminal sorting domain